MGKRCFVPDCTSTSRKVKIHRIPKDNELCRKWMMVINNPLFTELNMNEIRNKYVVCQRHFENSAYCELNSNRRTLKQNSVPTLFLPGAELLNNNLEMCEVEIETYKHEVPLPEAEASAEIVIQESNAPSINIDEPLEAEIESLNLEHVPLSPGISYTTTRTYADDVRESSLLTPEEEREEMNEDLESDAGGIEMILESSVPKIIDDSSAPTLLENKSLKMKKKTIQLFIKKSKDEPLTPVAKVIHGQTHEYKKVQYQTTLKFKRKNNRGSGNGDNCSDEVFEILHTFTSSCPNHENDNLSCSVVKVSKKE